MSKIKQFTPAATVVLILLLLSACFAVRIVENVGNPDRYFQKAHARIAWLYEKDPDRKGEPHQIRLLIFDRSDRKLIKISVPLWIVNSGLDIAGKVAEEEDCNDLEGRYDFHWQEVKKLSQLGPGLLVDIEDEDTKILIWLE